MGKRYLGFAFLAFGVLGKNVEDEHGAVNDLDVKGLFQGNHLARGQLTIADHGINIGGLNDVFEFLDFTGPNVGAGVGPVAFLIEHINDFGSGGLGEGRKFTHGGFDFGGGAFGPHAHQNDPFEAEFSVFDVVSVVLVGGIDVGAAGDAAEGRPFFEVKLTGRGHADHGHACCKHASCGCISRHAGNCAGCGYRNPMILNYVIGGYHCNVGRWCGGIGRYRGEGVVFEGFLDEFFVCIGVGCLGIGLMGSVFWHTFSLLLRLFVEFYGLPAST